MGFIEKIMNFLFGEKRTIIELLNNIKKNKIEKIKKNLSKLSNIDIDFEIKDNSVQILHANLLIASIFYNADIEIIKYLLNCGFDVNKADENKNTPILYASLYYKNPEIFDILISSGANINQRNIIGANSLLISIYNDNIEILKKNISIGCNVNSQNNGGWSALMAIALDKRPSEMAHLLIENGADVLLKNKTGKTALDIAKEYDNKEIIEIINQKIKRS